MKANDTFWTRPRPVLGVVVMLIGAVMMAMAIPGLLALLGLP